METIHIKTSADLEKTEDKSKLNMLVVSQNFSKQDDLSHHHFIEDKANKIIQWGKDNMLPELLVKASKTKSTKHSSIISRKCKMIAGNGWQEAESSQLKEFIENKHGEKDLNKVAKLVTNDYEVLNLAAIGVRWNEDKTQIAALDYIPAFKGRKSMVAGHWKFSDNWKDAKSKKSNTQLKQEFSTTPLPDDFDTLSDKEKKFLLNQVLIIKNEQIGAEDYPTPTYAAGIDWIFSDAGISTFTLNMIKKNFTGGYHINFPTGIPDADERKAEKRKFIKHYGGEDGDSIIITFSDPNAENVPELKALPSTGNEDIYNETEKRAQENIFIAHEVTNPALFGIRVSGELGGKNELQESLELFQVIYIDQRQEDIEDPFNMLVKVNKIAEEMKLVKYSLEVEAGADDKGAQLARKISKLPDNMQSVVLAELNKQQILSLAGIEPVIVPVEDGVVQPLPTEDVAKQALNGAQIASIVEVIGKIGLGELTPEQAKGILLLAVPGLSTTAADALVKQAETEQ